MVTVVGARTGRVAMLKAMELLPRGTVTVVGTAADALDERSVIARCRPARRPIA